MCMCKYTSNYTFVQVAIYRSTHPIPIHTYVYVHVYILVYVCICICMRLYMVHMSPDGFFLRVASSGSSKSSSSSSSLDDRSPSSAFVSARILSSLFLVFSAAFLAFSFLSSALSLSFAFFFSAASLADSFFWSAFAFVLALATSALPVRWRKERTAGAGGTRNDGRA